MQTSEETKKAQVKPPAPYRGQVRGLQRLIEDDNDCVDVLTQVSATTRALSRSRSNSSSSTCRPVREASQDGWTRGQGHGDNGSDCQIGAIMKQQINVQGMTCEHCVKRWLRVVRGDRRHRCADQPRRGRDLHSGRGDRSDPDR